MGRPTESPITTGLPAIPGVLIGAEDSPPDWSREHGGSGSSCRDSQYGPHCRAGGRCSHHNFGYYCASMAVNPGSRKEDTWSRIRRRLSRKLQCRVGLRSNFRTIRIRRIFELAMLLLKGRPTGYSPMSQQSNSES
jgi:hypothetical protein